MGSTICVFSNKGGTGKTTVAVHLALAYAQTGTTALLDMDPQGTAAEWLRRRPTELKSPLAVPCPGRDSVLQALGLARQERIEHVILDLPPHSSAQVTWLLESMDLILVPTRATATDLVTLKQTIDLVHGAKRPAGFILNAFRAQLVEAREISPILATYQLPIVGSLGDRIAYSRGLPAGLGGHEMGDEIAAQELARLVRNVSKARDGALDAA
ncbi:MAG: AAA family ATPase [Candidatus Dormibacteria bacterium]